MFDRDLRQQKSALCMKNNQKSMPSDFDRLGKDRLQRRKKRDLDVHLFELGLFHRSESRVLYCSADGASDDGFSQGLAGFCHPDATL